MLLNHLDQLKPNTEGIETLHFVALVTDAEHFDVDYAAFEISRKAHAGIDSMLECPIIRWRKDPAADGVGCLRGIVDRHRDCLSDASSSNLREGRYSVAALMAIDDEYKVSKANFPAVIGDIQDTGGQVYWCLLLWSTAGIFKRVGIVALGRRSFEEAQPSWKAETALHYHALPLRPRPLPTVAQHYDQQAYAAQQQQSLTALPHSSTVSGKGSWLARVSHRASHIPNHPLTPSSAAPSKRDSSLQPPLRSGAAASGATSPGILGSSFYGGSHERLPSLQKTSSWTHLTTAAPTTAPASPRSNPSPIESEFGTTPIDASFGDRVELQPERAQLRDYLGTASQQRNRSGTLQQGGGGGQQGGMNGGSKMDKYSRQAGDHTYDSDADADDEFERSVFASPTIPTHFADDQSDHPSESEEEHESIDGEDTPTTQGWADRDARSPTGNIRQWTEEQAADFIAALVPPLKQLTQDFVREGINGEALIYMQHDELRELGIASVGHRLTILKAIYGQKMRSGVKVEEGDYVPLSAEGDKGDLTATQDDITRVIESIRLRDQRIIAAEAELRALKQDLDRIADENRKLREEALPIMRLVKDQRQPLPDPAGGTLPSPRDAEPPKEVIAPVKESKLSRKFSTKKLFLSSAPKQPSPTHPPASHTPQPREVRDDGGAHLEASAAAMAASSHLTASMTSQTSPNIIQGSQLSPTSPAYSNQPSSGGSYHTGSNTARSFPRSDGGAASARHAPYTPHPADDTGYSNTWSQANTVVQDPPATARRADERRRQAPTPSPREDDAAPASAPLPKDRGDRDNPQVELFKSFRVSIDDPCEVVLPVALKRYDIRDDWRQYALYIVHGDQERCLGLKEKPLMLFKQLDKEGRKPMFMLRRHASPMDGWSGRTGGAAGEKHIPGGVL